MERLTIPDVRVDEHTTRRSVIDVLAVQKHAMEIYHQLKIYEDIAELCGGFDGLRELAEADKDGRVVVLPCKVGDVVYGFHNNRQTILPMVAKWIETNADGWTVAAQYAPMVPEFYQFSDFGKTVFPTREEAEKALQEMEGAT